MATGPFAVKATVEFKVYANSHEDAVDKAHEQLLTLLSKPLTDYELANRFSFAPTREYRRK